MLKLKSWTDSNSHTKCYTTKVLFIWFSYSLFLLSSLTSFRSNRFRVKSHQFSAAYLWRVTDYRFTRGHLVIYSLSICYQKLIFWQSIESGCQPCTGPGVSHWNVSFQMALTEKNMQVRSSEIQIFTDICRAWVSTGALGAWHPPKFWTSPNSKVIIVFFDIEKYQCRIISDTHTFIFLYTLFSLKITPNRTEAMVQYKHIC